MEVIGSRGGRRHVATRIHQRQGGRGYHSGQENQSSNQNSATLVDLWRWLVNNGVWRCEIDRKPTEFLVDLCKQKNARSSEQESNLSHTNRVMVPQVIPRPELVYRPRPPLEGRETRSPGGGIPYTSENVYC